MKTRLTLMLVAIMLAGSASARTKHCRVPNSDGSYVNTPALKTRADCEAKLGKWTHHHAHCTATDAAGVETEYPHIKHESACESAGHEWDHHGPAPARKEK